MLDENLPTFHFRPSSENPSNTVLYFTHQGSDPTPQYVLKRADSSNPAARNKYASALTDIASQHIIYAEVLVEPEWTQPTLSAAEARAQNGSPAPPQPILPDQVTLQLYNPDSQVVIKTKAGSWGKSDSWEFEMPEQSFREPSASMLDRSSDDPPISDTVPKVVFRWKRDGRLSRDMTCYMVGKSVAGKKSKEPDITVAMFKDKKHESAVTIYEPNLQRVDVEDRKGLDIVLLLGAEVLRDLFLNPRQNVFNLTATPPAVSGRRKNSKPPPPQVAPVAAMSGAIGNKPASPPAQQPMNVNNGPPRPNARQQWEIDNETKRLQAMVAEEQRQARERERRDAEEAKRITKMLEKEDKERRRKEAEIERETERLRRLYGVPPNAPTPNLPPRHQPPPGSGAGSWHVAPAQPPRPSSAGPYQHQGQPGTSAYRPPPQVQFAPQQQPPSQQQVPPQQQQQGGRGKLPNLMSGLLQGPYGNTAASVSNFFHRDRAEEERKQKIAKKRSVHF
ncbi:hypothetical protein CkaCkLH20_04511 [Colletotrichum karsti]|uniref:Uncharacterized protein n=1 Tax=Colletotrichum karsti TaxID=1095194 RepID=A0A9P6LM37_9PEZI|nr:uncharacterized protein CkaCkLH20_04511 [Colletotrichum karsti]KAF9877935.1 hypothetical protein CkaCkLH20_04511 [Colletotrichum karsti]